MAAPAGAPPRLGAATAAAKRFVDGLPPGLQVGLLTFDSSAIIRVAPTSDHIILDGAIDALGFGGGTATGAAIQSSLDAIAGLPADPTGKKPGAAVVLMSDGTPTIGSGGQTPSQTGATATAKATDAHIPIDTIAFVTPDV